MAVMGHHVTVEGSVTPSDWLGRGVRRTVAVTDHIRKLVKIGAVVVVKGSLDGPAFIEEPGDGIPKTGIEVPLGETAELVSEDTGGPYTTLPPGDESDYGPDAVPLEPLPGQDDRVAVEPPARNASREDWAEWVAVKVPDAVTEGVGRDELRQIWDDFDGR